MLNILYFCRVVNQKKLNIAAENLKKYLQGYYIELNMAQILKIPPSDIDKILDRINEIKLMIEELEKEGK